MQKLSERLVDRSQPRQPIERPNEDDRHGGDRHDQNNGPDWQETDGKVGYGHAIKLDNKVANSYGCRVQPRRSQRVA
jgi:hypothetical protein